MPFDVRQLIKPNAIFATALFWRQLCYGSSSRMLVFEPQMEWEKGELHMFTVRPDETEVEERWYESDSTMRFKIALLVTRL